MASFTPAFPGCYFTWLRAIKAAQSEWQVSHPNICRVYDISELDGRHFLTMEYIDGEDLASLLKRIGNLHGTKTPQLPNHLPG